METNFKIGDRVFCILSGWGTITGVNIGEYPFSVEFDTNQYYTYSKDGCLNRHSPPTLSFTEYTLEGFSQERPNPLPKRGDVVWVRDVDTEPWFVSHFISKKDEWYHTSCFMNEKKHLRWRQLTTKNPYANEQ